jgi:transposase-like protein
VKISLTLFFKLLTAWIKEFPVAVAAEACGTSHVTVRRYYQLFRQYVVKSAVFKPRDSVQVDEAYFGQFRRQANYYHGFKKYTVIDKVCVAGIGCPITGQLYARVIRETPKGEAIRQMIREQVPRDITVYADGSYIYTRLRSEYQLIQQTHDLGFHNAWFIEGCWSWMKRKLFKMYHHFDRRYAEEYIAELVWRFNSRKSPKDPWVALRNSF